MGTVGHSFCPPPAVAPVLYVPVSLHSVCVPRLTGSAVCSFDRVLAHSASDLVAASSGIGMDMLAIPSSRSRHDHSFPPLLWPRPAPMRRDSAISQRPRPSSHLTFP